MSNHPIYTHSASLIMCQPSLYCERACVDLGTLFKGPIDPRGTQPEQGSGKTLQDGNPFSVPHFSTIGKIAWTPTALFNSS